MLIPAEAMAQGTAELSRWWRWCLSAQGRAHAAERAAMASWDEEELMSGLLQALAVSG